MRGRCDQCAHFRPLRNLSEILRLPASLELAQTTQVVMQTEQQLVGKEEACKFHLLKSDSERWPFKPQVQSYCGFRDDRGVYLVHQVKNASQQCNDFTPERDGSSRPCDACAHQHAARGQERDHQNVMDAISPLNFYAPISIDHQSSSAPNSIANDMQTLMQVSQKQRAQEMLMALNNAGVMPAPPQYYAHCGKYSAPGKYVLCCMQNPHNRCSGHSSVVAPAQPAASEEIEPGLQDSPAGVGNEAGVTARPRSAFFRNLARRMVEEMEDG